MGAVRRARKLQATRKRSLILRAGKMRNSLLLIITRLGLQIGRVVSQLRINRLRAQAIKR